MNLLTLMDNGMEMVFSYITYLFNVIVSIPNQQLVPIDIHTSVLIYFLQGFCVLDNCHFRSNIFAELLSPGVAQSGPQNIEWRWFGTEAVLAHLHISCYSHFIMHYIAIKAEYEKNNLHS